MKSKLIPFLIILAVWLLSGCGKSDLEIQKEKIRREAAELKDKIDSSRMRLDSAMVEYDSLQRRITKQSNEIDSLVRKINPLK